jgi:hypothetical protein
MKKAALLVGVSFIPVFAWFYGSNVQSRKALNERPNATESTASTLTPEEERDLKIWVPQALSWFAVWSESGRCLWNGEIVEAGFLIQYNQYKLQEVPMGLDIGERDLVVYFDSLHTYLRFKRLHKLGLTPGDPTFNCDPSYADYKAGVELQKAKSRPDYEAAIKRAKVTNPEFAEARKRYDAAHADFKVRRNEIRSYFLAPLAEQPVSPQESWTGQKKELYEKVLTVMRSYLKSSYQPGDKIEITIPAFELGDPATYVLVKGPNRDDHEIVWISFERDESGKYSAHQVKIFGLPDEMRSLVPLIRKYKVAHVTLRKQ